MQEIRPAHEALLQPLKTKSAKIRALAKAGYSRVEIGKILGIRYQHVRKVLEDAGMAEGKKPKAGTDSLVITVPLPRRRERKKVPCQFLLDAGFQRVGEWRRTDKGIAMSAKAPAAHGIYSLALDGVIVYVGLTLNGLHTRMEQYRRGHKGQKTSARINGLICKALDAGQAVEVLIAAAPPALEWDGLPGAE